MKKRFAQSARRAVGVGQRAFTLLEMIVVMVIIVLVLSIAIPAFSNMVYAQEEIAAQSQLEAALSSARDSAIRNGPGDDTAAVFTFQPGGRLTVVTAVRVGTVHDPRANPPAGFPDQYEVFAPISGASPVQLPPNWMVRAYAPANTVGVDWYPASAPGARYALGQPAWVFPETGFFDHSRINDGQNRNTFMVRFAGGSGALSGMSMPPTLVVLPRPSSAGRTGVASDLWQRADRAEDLVAWAKRVLTEPTSAAFRPIDRWDLIGRQSGDMALAMPLLSISLYDETRLARALGTRPDRVSGTILTVDPAQLESGWSIAPTYNSEILSGAFASDPSLAISRWIEGYADLTSTTDQIRADVSAARLFTISRYLGTLQALSTPRPEEVSP